MKPYQKDILDGLREEAKRCEGYLLDARQDRTDAESRITRWEQDLNEAEAALAECEALFNG